MEERRGCPSEKERPLELNIGKVPSDEELRQKFNLHIHHLVERAKGEIKSPFGIIEGEDWYCHTCKSWICVYGIKFDTEPKKVGRRAFWVEGMPEEEKRKIEEARRTYELLKPILLRREAEKGFKKLIKKLKDEGLGEEEIKEIFERVLQERPLNLPKMGHDSNSCKKKEMEE